MKRRFIAIAIVIILLLSISGTILSESKTNYSIDAASQFVDLWNEYHTKNNTGFTTGFIPDNDEKNIKRLYIDYNFSNRSPLFTSGLIPENAYLYLFYDTASDRYVFCIYNEILKGNLESAAIYLDDKIINNLETGNGHGLEPEWWSIKFTGEQVSDVYQAETFTLKLTIDGKNAYVDITEESNEYIYDMITLLGCFMKYADLTDPDYLSTALLPEDSEPSEAPAVQNEQAPKKESSYSFKEDPDAVEAAAHSLFYVEVYDKDLECLGLASGFVAFDEHLFVTNQHVIEGATFIKIWDEDNNMYVLNEVVASDKRHDIAILDFPDGQKYKSLELSTDTNLKRAQPVIAIGNPKGYQGTVSEGIISALPKLDEFDGLECIQFSAPISQGSSGGALFDDNGKVIGITSAGSVEGQNLNFAIPASAVYELYNNWNKEGRATLGTKKSWDMESFSPLNNIEVTIGKQARKGIYDGDRLNNTPNGYGEFESNDEGPVLTYAGNWKNGKAIGEGHLIDTGYTVSITNNIETAEIKGIYEGEAHDGIPNGKGKFTAASDYNNPWIYNGEFIDGKICGIGEITKSNGTTSSGFFFNGEQVSENNTLTWADIIVFMAKKDSIEVNSSSLFTIKHHEELFTSNRNIPMNLVNGAWSAEGYMNNSAQLLSHFVTLEKAKVVNSEYLGSIGKYNICQMIIKDTNGFEYIGYINESSNKPNRYQFKEISLIPLGLTTYTDKDNKSHEAILCAYAKSGSKVADTSDNSNNKANNTNNENVASQIRKSLDLPTIHYSKQGKNLLVSFDIENSKDGEKIKEVELYTYAADKDYKDLYNGKKYTTKSLNAIQPGSTMRSQQIALPDGDKIAHVFCGIHRVTLMDGKIITFEKVNYSSYDFRD